LGWTLAAFLLSAGLSRAADESGFQTLFDGKTLNGWKLVGGHGPGYVVQDGEIICPAEGGGNLFTEKEYSNFAFRFEFKLTPGANNGVGIRAPFEGDAAYKGRFRFWMTRTRSTRALSVPNSTTARCIRSSQPAQGSASQ
jgi:hypothetical protein